ncbi:MAG: hypothetical protein DRI65_17830 [Chloroflexota bacterium]|nr:MAG: hypothetical protein DRI65_17830 [Chloroflexota bacterium]
MANEILAAGTTAEVAADVVVIAGSPVNVALFRDDENRVEHKCQCSIFKQDPNGDWNPTSWTLNRDSPVRIIAGAGTYQIRRPALSYATGISTD